VLYVVPEGGGDPEDLSAALRGPVAERLLAAGAHGIQVNVADGAVAPAAGLRMAATERPAAAVVGVWLDSAVDQLRAPFDAALAEVAPDHAAYLVTESVPLAHRPGPAPGERTEGMAQMAFLRRPDGVEQAQWLEVWLQGHTPVAVATQSTFGYVQNVVARALTAGAPPWAGIVEELFPAAAMTDPHVFFDAVGDEDRLRRHMEQMMESTQRFLDYSQLDVIPTSRYVLRPVPA
jgi:hypothetical protein